jgi:predicted phosphodiesterase
MADYAVISDVHANLEALQAVLKEIERERVDSILFLGDSVGYGPDPNECTEIVRDRTDVFIAGNHDRAAAGMNNITNFNPFAMVAIEWTGKVLTYENRDFLKGLPLTKELKDDDIFLVHGSPKEPHKWHYLRSEYDAQDNFPYFREKMCFVGHSHAPFIIEYTAKGRTAFHYNHTTIKEKSRYIINAGSIGQPRDGNPDAAYALLRDDTIEINRVSYDILVTQKKMKKAGLPSYLINRLSEGR